jgi:hypothetical protein
MNKEKILLYSIYLAGVISLMVFITTKSETLMDIATARMFNDGDLYRFAKIYSFKTKLPPQECKDDVSTDIDPDTTSIIIIGDSFMETCRGHKRFPVQISERLGKPVSSIYAGWTPEYFDPVYYCWKNNIDREKKRIVLVERVERYLIDSYGTGQDEDTSAFQDHENTLTEDFWSVQKRRWFTEAEKNYEVFLTSSDYTSPLIELWNTFRFTTLKQISSETPVYSLNPPFLFEAEEISRNDETSFYYPHTDSLIAQIADNIALQKDVLLSDYNAELVFMPVPNPYTLYHTFINNDTYDNYLPRLCSELEKRGVRTIQLYEKFREAKNILYFPTDTHWNAEGAAIAVDQTMNVLSRIDIQSH